MLQADLGRISVGYPPDRESLAVSDLVRDAAAGIVHDLGNLIQIATSAISLLSRSPGIRADESLQPLLGRARTSLERAGALVHQTMGRTPSRQTTLKPVPETVEVGASVAEIADLIGALCEPDIAFAMTVEEGLSAVTCRRLDLQNAILNLAINARDAMSDGGNLTLVVCRATGGPGEEAVDIKVMDDGVGMDAATLTSAFRTRFTTKPEGRGNGLGLAMVKRFVDDAGGEVFLASAPGIGTTVNLRLPTVFQAALSGRNR